MRSFSCFKPRDPFRNWSKELDKRVAIWAHDFDSSFKLLLLGPAGAGKTTIMKQMKIIHFEGFSVEERKQKAKEIRANLLESVRELTACITASGHQIDWCDKENQNRLDFINGLNLDDQTYEIYAAKIYDYSKRILTDKGVEELFAKLNQLSITHRSQYLLNRVDEIRNANYIPNNDDILQSRRRTSDIQKLEFQVKLPVKSGPSIQQTFCMFDVGGQRGERRKWIQVFDGVSAVMFLIDSSSFDAIDDENGRNKLKETINLFNEVWTTRFLLNSNFVLLFNKQDILREKIERGLKIEDHFPEYRLYKYQPTVESRQRNSDKLNLFRSTSNRSTRSTSSSSSSSVGRAKVSSAGDQAFERVGAPGHTPATKRKSASMYLFGTSSSKSSVGKAFRSPAARSPAPSAPATPTPQQQQQQQPSRALPPSFTPPVQNSGGSTAPTKPASEFHEAAALDGASTTDPHHYLQQQDQNRLHANDCSQAQSSPIDQAIAKHFAYLKARSFIRDKFLQVTRQVQLHKDQRKFSSPSLPLHSSNSGAAGTKVVASAANGLARTNCPRRNVCYHYTTATDTENIRDLFENLQKMVFKSTLKETL